MSRARKAGILLILIGLCLPTATLPFISEFHPLPNVCLTSNFFGNLGNMVIVVGTTLGSSRGGAEMIRTAAIPYKYLFASGVLLTLTGAGITILSSGRKRDADTEQEKRQERHTL